MPNKLLYATTLKFDESHILHHSQEQAFRPVPQRVDFLVERALLARS